jgi:acetyltransferase
MSQRGLEALLRPKSIAVLGASQQPGRAGNLMMSNLLAGGFNGPVMPVTPRYKAVCGVMAYPDVASLPLSPDLAILCTHAHRNLALIEDLGKRGCKTAIVLSSPPEQFAELKPARSVIRCACWGRTAWACWPPGKASTPVSRRYRS